MSVVGVLALQGDFEEHTAVFESLGAECKEIRLPKQMDDIDRLVLLSVDCALIMGSVIPLKN